MENINHMKISTKVKTTGIFCAAALLAAGVVNAQEPTNKGQLSGSFETNTIWYMPDKYTYTATNPLPNDRIGSNNYLKLDYSVGKFSAGIQGELYAPVLQGYDSALKGAQITHKYAKWTDNNFEITVGDFYDQYGSGMIFRSYEDRALGINTGLEGVRAAMHFGDFFSVSAMMGRPRYYMEYLPVWLRGADATLSLSSLFGFTSQYLALEGSYLSQYDETRMSVKGENGHPLVPANMNAWSARLVYEVAGFSLKAELVGKAPSVYSMQGTNQVKFGRGQLIELGYSGYGWGISLTGRNLYFMDMKMINDVQYSGLANQLNYTPALTRQYTYSLANLDPYSVHAMGEKAAQMDIYYNIRRGSALGGRYGTKLHLNGSITYESAAALYNTIGEAGDEMHFAYLDASFDLEKQWNKKFKTTILLAFQRMNTELNAKIPVNRYIAVVDGLYKLTSRQSLRLELQYLYSPFATQETINPNTGMPESSVFEDKKNRGSWWAASLEYSFAPKFSVFVSDMYNFESEKVHYYSVGMSYTKGNTRIGLSYGRNREGYVCSGGVCRQMPGYTGINLSLTTSF